jgi:hypothetical protein
MELKILVKWGCHHANFTGDIGTGVPILLLVFSNLGMDSGGSVYYRVGSLEVEYGSIVIDGERHGADGSDSWVPLQL